MDLGSIFGGIGNFLGGLFGQKKKEDNQPQQAPAQQAPITQPSAGIQAPKSLFINTQSAPAQAPTVTLPKLGGVDITPAATPQVFKPAFINTPTAQTNTQYKGNDLSGLSNEDTSTAQHLIDNGKIASGFINAARNSKTAQDAVNYNNSPVGGALNFAGEVGKSLIAAPVGLAEGLGTALASNSGAVQGMNTAIDAGQADDLATIQKLGEQLKNPNLDPTVAQHLFDYRNSLLNTNPNAAQQSQASLNADMLAKTDPLTTILNAAGTAALPLVGGLVGAGAKTAVGTAANALVDPLSLLSKVPDESLVGKVLNTKIGPKFDPNSPITASPTTNKAPAITSANPEFAAAPEIAKPPVLQAPEVAPTPAEVLPTPAPTPSTDLRDQTLGINRRDNYDTSLAKLDKALDKGKITYDEHAAYEDSLFNQYKKTGDAIAADATPPTSELGSITHNAVMDGSINTPEGITKAIGDTRIAANAAAEASGDTLPNIIRKGQAIWSQSKTAGHDLTEAEVQNGYSKGKQNVAGDASFTPEQQQVYKNYMQEETTLRDRAGYSLDGGNQGAWYGPRQSLTDDGESAVFDPKMINEVRRNGDQASSGVPDNKLDTSETPVEHAMQRYANAPNAMSQQMVDRVETNAKGIKSGIVVPEEAKANLESALTDAIAKRDAAVQAATKGDTETANAMKTQAEDGVTKAFSDFIDGIPGKGSARTEAINDVKAMRSGYRQSLMQVLSLSNLTNRVSDQGGKVVALLKRPLENGIAKVVDPIMGAKTMEGADSTATNFSKEMYQAAKEVSKGELGRTIGTNFKASMSLAGAGRNPLMKSIAKVAEIPSALNSAATEFGDLGTSNLRDALHLGASRPEAQGLTTVAEYKEYFGKYMQTSKFKEDLSIAQRENNAQIGLSGGKNDNMASGGKISSAVSKYGDNFVKNVVAPGIKVNPENVIVRNVNDYVKGNVTGYAGVGSRLLGYAKDSLVPVMKLKEAVNVAGNGSPNARAQATQMASKQIASTITSYGSIAGAVTALNAGPLKGVIGYTGPRAVQGSTEASYNKDHSIPPNQWYVNFPNGQRAYVNMTRTFNAPGFIGDVTAGALTSKDPGTAIGNAATQIYSQAGGNSLPDNVVNATKLADPGASPADKKYASEQLQQVAAPSTGILNNIANWTDPTKRAPTNFVDDIKSNLPGLRSQTPVAKDSAGNALPNSKQLSGGSSVFSVAANPDAPQTAGADPVAAEVTRFHNAGVEVTPLNSSKGAKDANVQDIAKILLNDPLYQNADDTTKATYLKDVLAGTHTKGVNQSLSTTDKQALLDYKLQTPEVAKASLDDNKTAANYHTALYDNAKATPGALSLGQDDISKRGSLHYNAVAAQVDQQVNASYDLKSDYATTKQAAFKAMLNPKSDTYDVQGATDLYNYDKARVAAGLPAQYNLAKAEQIGKSGSGGSAATRAFTFASLPSSLIGTGSAGSSTAGKSADGAPLFKSIPSLQAPASVAIPNGRSISVTKGVKV